MADSETVIYFLRAVSVNLHSQAPDIYIEHQRTVKHIDQQLVIEREGTIG